MLILYTVAPQPITEFASVNLSPYNQLKAHTKVAKGRGASKDQKAADHISQAAAGCCKRSLLINLINTAFPGNDSELAKNRAARVCHSLHTLPLTLQPIVFPRRS